MEAFFIQISGNMAFDYAFTFTFLVLAKLLGVIGVVKIIQVGFRR